MSPHCRLFVLCCALAVLDGCAKTNVMTTAEYRGALPAPDMVIVFNFATTPAEAQMTAGQYTPVPPDPAEFARLQEQRMIGQIAADALSNALVSELQQMGVLAMRAAVGTPIDGNILEIRGQFLSLSETQKTIGVKGSNVMTSVRVYETIAAGRQLVEQFQTDANSGFQGKVNDDAKRTAKDLAQRIGKLYEQKGWTLSGMMP